MRTEKQNTKWTKVNNPDTQCRLKGGFLLSLILCAAIFLFPACTKNAASIPEGSKTVTFQVTNYVQYELEEGTRSTPVASSSALQHLALGVFDASTDKMVGSMQVQKRGDEGYGSFTVTLPYGNYRLVFLGYSGNKVCTMDSPSRIYFGDNYIPQTFLCAQELTVNAETTSQADITLRRAVSGFQLHMEDAIPADAVSFRCKATGGGNVLDSKTGLAVSVTGKESTVSIPESAHGQTDKKITIYLFLTSDPESVDFEVSALDSEGGVIASRRFTDVPMSVNKLTVYKGSFFSTDKPWGFDIKVEEEWGETVENAF